MKAPLSNSVRDLMRKGHAHLLVKAILKSRTGIRIQADGIHTVYKPV